MLLRPVRAAAILTLFVTAAAHAQTADDVIKKNLAAKGGAEKWKSISSVKMTGTVDMQGKKLPMTVYAKRPNFTRQEMVLGDRTLVQAFDGQTAWMINPMMGTDAPQALPEPVSQVMKNTSEFDGPLVNYKEKGHTVELLGKETLDGTAVYHLEVTTKDGRTQHYYLDAESGVERKKSEQVDIGTGQKQVLETVMSDYQNVQGVMVPKSIRQLVGGKPMAVMAIDTVEFNSGVEDQLFRMPAR